MLSSGPTLAIGGNLATSQGHRKGAPSLPDPGGYLAGELTARESAREGRRPRNTGIDCPPHISFLVSAASI
jgi:hypothetical protein